MDNPVTIIEADEIDPRLKGVADHLAGAMSLAARKAALHAANPTQNPIDEAGGSLEAVLYARLKTRAPKRQQAAIARATAAPAPAGALAAIDLKSATPIMQQLGGVAIADGARQSFRDLVRQPAPPPAPGDGGGAPASFDDDNTVLNIRIRRIECVQETAGWGDDEILLGGAVTNNQGASAKVDRMNIGDMTDDTDPPGPDDTARRIRVYHPPRLFHAFPLANGINGSLRDSGWPKAYIATLVLCEQDEGGFPDFLKTLLEAVKSDVVKYVSTTLGAEIGGAIGTALFPGLGTAIGSAIGALVSFLLDSLIGEFVEIWEDDEFPPVTFTMRVNGYHGGQGAFTSAPHTLTARDSGIYKIELDGQSVWPTGFGNRLDAAVNWQNGKRYFFSGARYARYDAAAGQVDDGYPKKIADGWPGLWADGVDAGVAWNNGKAYFFKGDQYVRVDMATKKVDAGYPRRISDGWKGSFTRDIDAAVLWPDGKGYFFKGDSYVRVDAASKAADPGYPKKIADNWKGLWAAGLDAAFVGSRHGEPCAFFFKDKQWVAYGVKADRVLGDPQSTGRKWPGL